MSKKITTAEQLLALPLGTKLLDKDQDVVTRQGVGVVYGSEYTDMFVPAHGAVAYGPLTLAGEWTIEAHHLDPSRVVRLTRYTRLDALGAAEDQLGQGAEYVVVRDPDGDNVVRWGDPVLEDQR